jgi:hypothetical protein
MDDAMNQSGTATIRHAIAAGDFAVAEGLWKEYAAGIEEEIGRGICTSDRIAEAGALVEWSRLRWLCARSHIQDRLRAISAANRYAALPLRPPSLFRTIL